MKKILAIKILQWDANSTRMRWVKSERGNNDGISKFEVRWFKFRCWIFLKTTFHLIDEICINCSTKVSNCIWIGSIQSIMPVCLVPFTIQMIGNVWSQALRYRVAFKSIHQLNVNIAMKHLILRLSLLHCCFFCLFSVSWYQ